MNRRHKKHILKSTFNCRIMYSTEKKMIFFTIRPRAILTTVITQKNLVWQKLLFHFRVCVLPIHLTCFPVCLVPFLKASCLGVTLSLWTSPQDPVAISNQLREVAPPLLQPIAVTSLCDCAHACEWAGVLSFVCATSSLDAVIKLNNRKIVEVVCVDYFIKCSLTIIHLSPIYFNWVRTNVPGRDYFYANRREPHFICRLNTKLHSRKKQPAQHNQ